MQLSKYFKPETLMFAAFLATLPVYAPSQLLFGTGFIGVENFMAAFANTMLASAVVFGAAAALWSLRRGDAALRSRVPVTAASV
uniref:hypothetical protein n=1 Tax=uncultured Adlercreutzia sp. TaxID=875803 RepID=UPI00350F0F2F